MVDQNHVKTQPNWSLPSTWLTKSLSGYTKEKEHTGNQNLAHAGVKSPKNIIAYYHMKVEVLQTQDESRGDRFECCSHSDDILADICNAQYHLWKEEVNR